jgi:nucleoside-diphosphate-sugar epimerase
MGYHAACVLVTGSSGLIGRAVCRALLRDGYAVIGLDRPDGAEPPEGITNIPCDVGSEESVSAALSQVRDECGNTIASAIHLAAYYDFSGEPSPLYEEITVLGTERLLRHLKTFELEQFVFSSSMLVHAPCLPGDHIDEARPVEPKWDYPESKVRAEQVIQAEHANIPSVILRIAGVFTDRCQSIPLAHQIQRVYERRLTAKVFPGDTSTGQSFVHLDDLVEAVRAVVARRTTLPPETLLLIGEADPMSYDELQRAFAWLIHRDSDWETVTIPKAVAKAGAWIQGKVPGVEEPFIQPWMIDLADDHYALDISLAKSLLNWTPRRGLRETLPTMIEGLKADPVGWYRENKLEGTPPSEAAGSDVSAMEVHAAESRKAGRGQP